MVNRIVCDLQLFTSFHGITTPKQISGSQAAVGRKSTDGCLELTSLTKRYSCSGWCPNRRPERTPSATSATSKACCLDNLSVHTAEDNNRNRWEHGRFHRKPITKIIPFHQCKSKASEATDRIPREQQMQCLYFRSFIKLLQHWQK